MTNPQVIIIGAGAAGLMCAIEAGKRGRKVLVLDHANKIGKKILVSGGGRCNFTNLDINPASYLSQNPHFCKSALSQYQNYDFLALLDKYNISWYEKKLGQLFCEKSSKQIVNMLIEACNEVGVQIQLNCTIKSIEKRDDFILKTASGAYSSPTLVIAAGGLSFPKMGASPFGYNIAKQFGLNIIPPSAGLVPFIFNSKDKTIFEGLSGIACDALVSVNNENTSFRESLLFTHKGLSGPAILQISSYWKKDQPIHINLLPDLNLFEALQSQKHQTKGLIKNSLSQWLPKRLSERFCLHHDLSKPTCQYNDEQLKNIANIFQKWIIVPESTEGYRTAEVTLGGIDTNELSSKTMESKKQPGLYFIGEVIDVTGHLGGYNFQWAWSSGFCAGKYI